MLMQEKRIDNLIILKTEKYMSITITNKMQHNQIKDLIKKMKVEPKKDLSKYAGTIKWDFDPVVYQSKMRNEWY